MPTEYDYEREANDIDEINSENAEKANNHRTEKGDACGFGVKASLKQGSDMSPPPESGAENVQIANNLPSPKADGAMTGTWEFPTSNLNNTSEEQGGI